MNAPIDEIIDDIWIEVLLCLNGIDFVSICISCKHFNNFLHSENSRIRKHLYFKLLDGHRMIEDELAEASPSLELSESLILNITKEQLNQIHAMSYKPAKLIEMTFIAVCHLLDPKFRPKTWAKTRDIVSQSNIVSRMLKFDTKTITGKQRELIRKQFMSNTDWSFILSPICKNPVAKAMQLWVVTQVRYSNLLAIYRTGSATQR